MGKLKESLRVTTKADRQYGKQIGKLEITEEKLNLYLTFFPLVVSVNFTFLPSGFPSSLVVFLYYIIFLI
jgi:hypothetical protein